MAEIRDFHTANGETKQENFKFKIIRHRLGAAIRILIAVAIVITIAVVLRTQYKNQIYTNLVVSTRGDKENLVDNSYLGAHGSVITYSKDGISKTNGAGIALWNMTYEMQKPIVHQAGDVVGVCDYNGHIIYMIDANGREYEIDTNLPIRDFSVSKEERVAVILEDSGNSWINMYDINGNHLVEIKATMSKTGYPLGVALSGEVMGVAYYYVDGENMRSSVTFYNFGGIGENTSDHIVSSYDYADSIVPVIEFIDNENAYALADNRLMFFGGEKKPVSSSDNIISENIVGCYKGDKSIGLVFYDITGEHKYRLDIYNVSGVLTTSYSFDMDYKDILINNGQVMIYNESQCIVLNNEGVEKFAGTFEDDIICLTTTDSNKKYIAVTKDAIETLSFE